MFILLLSSLLVASMSLRPAAANPNILYVPSQYLTIYDALAHALSGDTIMVSSGVYNETNLVITQDRLTLQGQDKTNTIIDGQNSNKNITVVKANNVIIRGFTIRNAGNQYAAFGVYLYRSNNTLLKDNTFSGCYFSIRAEKSTNVTVSSSSFLGDTGLGGTGVYALSSQTGLIINNTFTADHVGVYLINGSTSFTIRNNTFSSSIFLGVNVAASSQNWVVKNTFRDNNSSVEMKNNGNNNTVVGNAILNSQTAGLIISSRNNVIHHNNFINNTQQVKFIGSPLANVWNTLNFAEGNYWSNYKGNDMDRNGIGDSPYNIASGNIDSYPLIGPFTEFSVTYQLTAYNIYTISNSTITGFSFNPVAKQISFQVSDTAGTLGICRVVFPNALFSFLNTVYVNGVSQVISQAFNTTHGALYFTYTHSGQPLSVVIVPEFPAVVIVAFLLMLTLLAIILKKKRV